MTNCKKMTEQNRDHSVTPRSGDRQNNISNMSTIHMVTNPKVIINQHLSKKLQEQNGKTYEEISGPLIIKNELLKPPTPMKNELAKASTSMKNQQNDEEHPTKKKPPPILLQKIIPYAVRMSKPATIPQVSVIGKPSYSKVANNPLDKTNSNQINNSPVKPKGMFPKPTEPKKSPTGLFSKLFDECVRLATFTVNYKAFDNIRVFTATYIYPDGSLEVRTAENFIEMIGNKRFDALMSALTTVQDKKKKNLAIQAFLTPKSDFTDAGTQTETQNVPQTPLSNKRKPARKLQVPYVLEKNRKTIKIKKHIINPFSYSEEMNEILNNTPQNSSQTDADDVSGHMSSDIISHASLPTSLDALFTPSLLEDPEKEVHKLVDLFIEPGSKHEKQSTNDPETPKSEDVSSILSKGQKRPNTELEVEKSKRRLIENFESKQNGAILYLKDTRKPINETACQSLPSNANGENPIQNTILNTNTPFLNPNNASGKVINTNSNTADTPILLTIDLAVQKSILQKLSASEHALLDKLNPVDWFHLAAPEKMKMLSPEEKKFILDIQMYIDCMTCLTADEDNNLPIHNAVLNNDLELLKRQCYILKAKNQSIDIGDANFNYSALQMCIVHHAPRELATFLLQHGASPLAPDDNDSSAVHLAAETTQPEHLELLLEEMSARPTVFLKGADLWSPEMTDCKEKELVDILLTHAINQVDNRGQTPLMIAARLGHGEHVMHLLEQLIDPSDSVNKQSTLSGETALYMAVVGACHQAQKCGDLSKVPVNYGTTINQLIRFGANPWIENKSGGNINLLTAEYRFCALNIFINTALGKTKFRPITMEISSTNEDGSEVIECTRYQGIQPFIIKKNDNGRLDILNPNNDTRMKHNSILMTPQNDEKNDTRFRRKGQKIHKSKDSKKKKTSFKNLNGAIVENKANFIIVEKTGEAMSYSGTVPDQKDFNETVDKISGQKDSIKTVDKELKFITANDIKDSHTKNPKHISNKSQRKKKVPSQERQTLDVLITNMKRKTDLEKQELTGLLSSNNSLLQTANEKHAPTTVNSITSIQNINTTLTSSWPSTSADDNATALNFNDAYTTQQHFSVASHLAVEGKGLNSNKPVILQNIPKMYPNDIKNLKIPTLKRKITVISGKNPTIFNVVNESARDQPFDIQKFQKNNFSKVKNMDTKTKTGPISNYSVSSSLERVTASISKIKSTKDNTANKIANDQPSNVQALLDNNLSDFNNIDSKTQMETSSDHAVSNFKKCTFIRRIMAPKQNTANAKVKDQPLNMQTSPDKNMCNKKQTETASNDAESSFIKTTVISGLKHAIENAANSTAKDRPSNKQRETPSNANFNFNDAFVSSLLSYSDTEFIGLKKDV